MTKVRTLIHLSTLFVGGAAFSTSPTAILAPSSRLSTRKSSLSAVHNDNESRISNNEFFTTLTTRTLTTAAISLAILASPLAVHADEWGKETEAPTYFTGETVMICKKRGPLGACKETTRRTVANDNDKAIKYFKDPSEEVKAKQNRMLQNIEEDSEGNALIQKLRKQSADNKEKNDQTVLTKTLLNDSGASFGPFNSQVVILNTDGKTFTLLQNPQAMRLKKAGYIDDRKFIIQPTQVVIDEALEGEKGLGDTIKGFFGGEKDGSSEEVPVTVEVKSEAADVVSSVAVEESAVVVVVGDELDEIIGEVTSDSN